MLPGMESTSLETMTQAGIHALSCFSNSLQEWRENELHASLDTFNPAVHEEVRLEKRRREALLGIRQALAREVSQKTREVAGE